ncbi:Hypothetical protein FKW44_004866 [Caligus rogercresseyi]|uniref:Uncharacterized protein n=1 Tax=Caligus rogercresseyi TaxID=217165 RepID=A0A7T8HMR6_CALRO|nr:Hypothetical protein FKW44_004866 [Caligus rogercresseyi]
MSHEEKNREKIADLLQAKVDKRDRGDCWLLWGYILQCFKGSKGWQSTGRTPGSEEQIKEDLGFSGKSGTR